MKIKCIIIEDEPLAVEVVRDFIAQVPFLELVSICNDAFSAMQTLNEKKIDLIFLDLHLPKLKGLDFLSTLKAPPMVIITSAYHEFALKSYEYNVIDYLLKPIEFNRFMVAINKVMDKNNNADSNVQTISRDHKQVLYFTVDKKKARIALDSILYIESQREHVIIVTKNKTITTRYAITDLEKELPASHFVRIHRSFIVAIDKVDFIDSNDVEIAGKEIPIGRSYKNFVLSLIST